MEPVGCSYIGKGNTSKANKRLPKDVDPLKTFALPFQYKHDTKVYVLLQVHGFLFGYKVGSIFL